MTEFMVRLSSLRDSAAQLRQSHQTINGSLNTVSAILSELTALGIEDHQLTTLGSPQIAPMTTLNNKISHFATQLDSTANDVELAVNQEIRLLPHFDLSLLPQEETPAIANLHETATVSATVPLDTGDLYVSPINQPLFRRLQEQQTLLEQYQDQRTVLIDQRDQLVNDLQATRNRALSHNPELDLNSVPRIQAMETEIANLNEQISSMNTTISDLDSANNALSDRLARVQPTSTADFTLIHSLETNPTSPHVVANTYDCVNHVVQKLPVPANMALDAHLWNDLVLERPEYGITIGNHPLEGAVIVLEREHAYADDVFGHLLYVESIQDGEIWVTDNYNPTPIRFSDLTTETTGENINFLYFPWHTRA